jgi:4-amino-4-deoxy-L-arabinose transferase-like glycosyltransferase
MTLEGSTKKIIILAIVACSIVVLVGISSDLSLGDEVYQYRFAELWYRTGERPLYDPLLETTKQCLYYFDSDPLWAVGLMGVWKLTGGVSKVAMQLYQASFYVGLIVVSYLLGKQLYNWRVGIYAAIFSASMPFFVAYSILGYLDVPSVFFAMLGFLMLAKKRYWWAGIVFGLAFMTKRSSWLLMPPIGLYLVLQPEWRIRNIIKFALPAGVISIPELLYRLGNWNGIFFAPPCSTEIATKAILGTTMMEKPTGIIGGLFYLLEMVQSTAGGAASSTAGGAASSTAGGAASSTAGGAASSTAGDVLGFVYNAKQWSWTPSNVFYDPLSLAKYLGVILLASLVVYLIWRKPKSRDIFLILPVVFYIGEWLYFFRGQWAVRYLSPILGLFVILGAIILYEVVAKFQLENERRKIVHVILLLIATMQFFAVLGYTYMERNFSEGIEAAHKFIKISLPEDARILYPEYSLSQETGRAMIWIRLNQLPYLFWQADESDAGELFDIYEITHVMVKKSRIYDDSTIEHRLGYPMTFINKLHFFDLFKLVFENDEIEIWEILR